VIDAKAPAGVRTVDIHDDLLDELAAYKQALGAWWQPTQPAFPDRRGGRLDRHTIARHVIAPAVERADELRAEQGLPPIGQHVTPHTLRYTYIASMFAAGADQEYVAAQVGHDHQPHLPVRAAAQGARRDRRASTPTPDRSAEAI
jgi:integrase